MLNMRYPIALQEREFFEVLDDFGQYTDAQLWTKLLTGAGSSVAASTTLIGGQLVLTTGGTQSNEAAVATTNSVFTPGNDNPMVFEARMQYVEANAHDAGIVIGFADAIGTTLMLTATAAALKSSFSGFVFYKLAGDTLWRVASSKTTTQTLNQTNVTIDDGSGSAFHTFRIEAFSEGPASSNSNFDVVFKIDGVQVVDNTSKLPVKHTVSYTSFANLKAGMYVQAGTAHSETPNLDYIVACQRKGNFA